MILRNTHQDILTVMVVLATGLLWLFIPCACSSPATSTGPRAAIVDQLHSTFPNDEFTMQITEILEESGFTVDRYSGSEVTVELYRELPSYGYQFILLRAHSGLLGVDPSVAGETWLYTSEPYSKTRYVPQQLSNQITYAKTGDNAPWFFAVNSKFIEASIKEDFDNTVVVMMGCDGLHYTDLAQAFVEKGCSVYIAWNASVLLDYVDDTTILLTEKLCTEDVTIEEAVSQTIDEKGPDTRFGSKLAYFPLTAASQSMNQLLQ